MMFGLAKMLSAVSRIFSLANNLSIRQNTIEFKILPRAGFQIDHEGAKMELCNCSIGLNYIMVFAILFHENHLEC